MEKNTNNNTNDEITIEMISNLDGYSYLPSNRGKKDWEAYIRRSSTSKVKVEQIKEGYRNGGMVPCLDPIYLNETTKHIIDGNYRAYALKQLWAEGWQGKVKVYKYHLSADEERDWVYGHNFVWCD